MLNTENEALVHYYSMQLLHSVINRDIKTAKQSYEILLDTGKQDKAAFKILSESRIAHLKKLSADIKNETFTRSFGFKKLKFKPVRLPLNITFANESCLKKFIIDNKVIEQAVSLTFKGAEYPSRYGRIDMLYYGDRVEVPCEVKLEIGSHDIITQIEKYIHHSLLYLHYGFYDYVEGITLAGGYTEFALKELKKLDVLILKYTTDNKNFYLECLNEEYL